MSFSRIRSPGAWTLNSVVDPAEFEALDANLANAIDGDAGGTYNPTAQLIIGGGYGLKVTAPFETTGTATCKNGLTVSTAGNFSCSRPGTFSDGLTISTAGSLTCSRPATFSGTIALNGNTTLDAAATLTCNGDTNHNGVNAFSGDTTFSGDLKINGSGKILIRSVTLADASASKGVDDGDDFRLPQTAGATRTLTIVTTNALQGARLRISRDYPGATSGTFAVAIPMASGTVVYNMGGASSEYKSLEITFDGTYWYRSAAMQIP